MYMKRHRLPVLALRQLVPVSDRLCAALDENEEIPFDRFRPALGRHFEQVLDGSKGYEFSPATTVADVKKFAAIREFGMKPADAAEHVLQFSGSAERPEPETHVGTLVSCPDCRISFDLVPHKRVEG